MVSSIAHKWDGSIAFSPWQVSLGVAKVSSRVQLHALGTRDESVALIWLESGMLLLSGLMSVIQCFNKADG